MAPSKIIAVHLTYRSRIEEYAARTPPEPSYFLMPPSALNHDGGELRRPRGARFLNYEGELAVVIGRRMKGVGIADALDHVAGYLPANDVGLHDFRHADRGSMLRVKGQDGFLPLGPELVPAADFDPTAFIPPVPAYEPPQAAPDTPPVPSFDALAPTGDDEVHELVGRIVARTQHLEDQLELARHLRFEITELVRRLAAAVERDR